MYLEKGFCVHWIQANFLRHPVVTRAKFWFHDPCHIEKEVLPSLHVRVEF